MVLIAATHTTSRPSVETVARDADGNAYTDIRAIPVKSPDMHIHDHIIVPNLLRTESGRITGFDLDRLGGAIKEAGAVYQAAVSQGCKELGIETVLDPETGSARLTAISKHVRDGFSRRHSDGEAAAREYAAGQGIEWDGLSENAKRGLLEGGRLKSRSGKETADVAGNDFDGWQERAGRMGYQPRTVLRPDDVRPS